MPNDIQATHVFEADAERVFHALTSPEEFAAWFGTEQVQVPLDRLDWQPEAGRAWSAVMQLPDGHEMHWQGHFTEVHAPDRLAFTITDQPDAATASPVTVDVDQVGPATRVTLTQDRGPFDDEQVAATSQGYAGFLDAMAAVIARDAAATQEDGTRE